MWPTHITRYGPLLLLVCLVWPSYPAASDSTPQFEQFSVKRLFKGRPAAVDLSSHRKARTWRTALRRGAKEGPNFAGHYTLTIWGCGSSCQAFAIVDAISGTVYFPRVLSHVTWGVAETEKWGLRFRLDSRLLIAYGFPNENEPRGIHFYEWKDNQLRSIQVPTPAKGAASNSAASDASGSVPPTTTGEPFEIDVTWSHSAAPPGLIEVTNPKPGAYARLTPAYALGYNLSPLRGDLTFRPLQTDSQFCPNERSERVCATGPRRASHLRFRL